MTPTPKKKANKISPNKKLNETSKDTSKTAPNKRLIRSVNFFDLF